VGWDTAQRRLIQELRREDAAGEAVLAVLARVPREVFLPENLRPHAYENVALPIGGDQTISQPTVVALMAEALELVPEHRVLEIGTGSGYLTAVLAEMARDVVSVERRPELAGQAERVLRYLGYANTRIVVGDGTLGWPPDAPYDRVVVSAAGPVVPAALVDQLAPGGRLVLPVGGRGDQQLVAVTRGMDGAIAERSLGRVQFVPLIGAQGWDR
jgi:protein-L-isoaspartate(D-aspartate) O-methyltransferase